MNKTEIICKFAGSYNNAGIDGIGLKSIKPFNLFQP